MKKILTASLVAMMAVTAARADIASTGYVDGKVKANTDLISAMDTAYKTADTDIKNKIGTVPADKTVVQMIADAVSGSDTGLQDAKDYTDEKVKALADGAVKANTQAIAGLDTTYVSENEMTTFKTSNTEAIADAKKAGTDAAAALAAYETANDAAVALKADKTALEAEAQARAQADTDINTTIGTLPVGQTSVVGYIESVSGGSTEAVEGVASDLAEYVASNDAAVALKADKTALEAEVGAREAADTELDGKIAAEKSRAEGAEADLQSAIDAVEGAAQAKSTAFSIGNAEGKWTAFTAIPGYCATGTCSLTTVDGDPTWVLVK